jgi:hypothetical protein
MIETAHLDTLLGYLAACGGCDRFEFHDQGGNPDPVAARTFAENLRAKYAAGLGTALTIEQVAHRVMVCVMIEAAPV